MIFGSDMEHTLVFEDMAMYKAYIAEKKALEKKYYDMICKTSGYWAGNQNKFVKSIDELNEWD
jgi:DNA topoisomerase VI subunit A